jgi:hypothetical protein
MKSKILHLIIYIGTIISVYSCSDKTELPDPEPETYENIAIVYWIGDNSLNNAAGQDIQELVEGKDKIPANSKIIIYADKRNTMPVIYQLDAKNGLKEWKKYTQEEDCTDSLVMRNNLRYIINNFPAKNYGLTFGSHGSGWIIHQRRALGPDESHNNNYINIPTLRGVLEQLPHFKYIFFDVCFMQSIEIAYELRNVTDWVIGSPAEIPADGAPYNLITKELCEGNVQGIVDKYDSYYPKNNFKGVILSAVDCNELESIAYSTSAHIKQVFANRQAIPASEEQGIQKYSSIFKKYTYCYDMNSAMSNILSPAAYDLWIEDFKKAVPLRKPNCGRWTSGYDYNEGSFICTDPTIYDLEHFGGISMYIPQDNDEGNIKNTQLRHYQWYKAAGWDQTGW